MNSVMRGVQQDSVGSVVQSFVDGGYTSVSVTKNTDGTYDIRGKAK